MSRLTTLQKAKKILNSYEEIQPRKHCIQPYLRSNQKTKHELSYSSTSKSTSKMKRDFSFCKSKGKLDSSLSSSTSCLKQKKHSNSSFSSLYNKQTRYDKIMRLKVKPHLNVTKRNDRNKKSVLSSNSVSLGSSRDENRENRSKNKFNRLEKIMQIKVVKPKVNSTLSYYQPRQSDKSKIVEKRESAVKEWKECQTKVRKVREQEDKEDRLWRVFERERDLRMKLKKNCDERMYKEERRKEQRFENIVSKEVHKIEKDREIVKRRSEVFSTYVYPSY